MCDKSWNEIEEEEQKYLDLVYEVSQLRNKLDLAESLYKLAIRERDYERTLCDFYKKEAMDLEMSYEKILQSKTELLKEENDLSKVEIHEISKFKIGDLVKLATGLGDPVDGVWKVKKNTVGLVTEVEFVGDSFTLYTVDFGQEEQYRCIISDVSEECLELFSKGAEPMPNKNEEIHEKEEHGSEEAESDDDELDESILHDRCHRDPGRARAAKTVRNRKSKTEYCDE